MNKILFSSYCIIFNCIYIYSNDYDNRMNVILIMADDLGYECIGANGGEYDTPYIDKLSREGIRFEHCYSNPLSTPSRVQLMTGKYNVRNYMAFAKLDRREITFANLLQKSGYVTCISGKWQLGKEKDAPEYFGFDRSCLWQHTQKAVDEHKCDTRYSNPIIDIDGKTLESSKNSFGPDIYCNFILDFIRENKNKPFFVYYPMVLTHSPFVSTPDSKNYEPIRSSTYQGNSVYFPDMVKYMDKLVGRIIDELERLQLRDNTLIIFTGDNGTSTNIVSTLNGKKYIGGKGKTIDSGIHVPLIVSCPKGLQGIANNELVDFTDFFPTICEVTRTSIPSTLDLDGKSFCPHFKSMNQKIREWIYCWYEPKKGVNRNAIVFARTVKYKLYRSGRFYNVQNDFYETKPILKRQMTNEQKRIYDILYGVINKYEKYAVIK